MNAPRSIQVRSPRLVKRTGLHAARRLQERISSVVPGSEEIRVAVLGGVAVLRGTTRLLAAKREAAASVLEESSIARVVNKIEVVAPQ
jgi:hypothetical protein